MRIKFAQTSVLLSCLVLALQAGPVQAQSRAQNGATAGGVAGAVGGVAGSV